MIIGKNYFNKAVLSRTVVVIVLLFPPLYILYLVGRYGVNVPFADEWEFVPLLNKASTGVLSFSDLWAQHAEHRIFFPKVVMLSVALLTRWNILYELYINIALAGGTLFFLSSMLKQSIGKNIYPWLLPLFSFLVFSPAQVENWLWGWQIAIFLNVLGFVAAVWAINRWSAQLKGFILAGAFLVVSTFSFHNGLLAWLTIAITFLIRKDVNVRNLVVWVVSSFSVIFLYYKGYNGQFMPDDLIVVIDHPLDYLSYILAYLGSPLGFGDRNISIALGLILLVATSAATIIMGYSSKETYRKLSPWLAIGLFAFLSALATGFGRLGFGVNQALAYKYTTISALFIIASLVILIITIEHFVRSYHPVFFSLSTLLALAFILSFSNGTKAIIGLSTVLHNSAVCLRDIDGASDECLKPLYWHAQELRERAKMLQKMNFSLYANTQHR